MAQGAQRIDANGAERWDGAGGDEDQHQSAGGCEKREGIGRPHAIQLPAEDGAYGEVPREPDRQSSCGRAQSLIGNQPDDIG